MAAPQPGWLYPVFSPETRDYYYNVFDPTGAVTLAPIPRVLGVTQNVTGANLTATGEYEVQMRVIDLDNPVSNYSVIINLTSVAGSHHAVYRMRFKPSTVMLTNLTIATGQDSHPPFLYPSLTPGFESTGLAYTTSVPNSQIGCHVYPQLKLVDQAGVGLAHITVAGVPTVSGGQSQLLQLKENAYTEIDVKAWPHGPTLQPSSTHCAY